MAKSSASAVRAGRAFVEVFADNSKLVRGLKQAEKQVVAFGSKVRNIGLGMMGAGAAIVTPLLAASTVFAGMGDTLDKMSKRTGASVEALSELQFAASQSGTDMATLENGLRRMAMTTNLAAQGSAAAQRALADLGLSARQLISLAPEDQIELLADRLAAIENPTLRAARAMAVLGRGGTALLPLFEGGGAGIAGMRGRARGLGLTVSTEDVENARKLTDALDAMRLVAKANVFKAGASIGTYVTRAADSITKILSASGRWIDANRQVIVTVAAVGVGIMALGAAITAAGMAIIGLGATLGGMATILTTIGTVLAALTTPLGLVITGAVAAGAAIVHFSGIGGRAVAWLGERFGQLSDSAQETFRAIGDAMAAGDIRLAADVLWKSLRLAWHEGAGGLLDSMHSFWTSLNQGWATAIASTTDLLHRGTARWRMIIQELKTQWQWLLAKEEDRGQIVADHEYAIADIKKERDDLIALNKQMLAGELDAIVAAGKERKDQREDDLEAAREAYRLALLTAKSARAGIRADMPGTPAFTLPDVSALFADISRRTFEIQGGFSAAAAGLMGFGTAAADRTADATERSAELLEQIERHTREQPTFG